jgi:hypothetical protein
MPVSSLQPCICALKHPKATLLTLNAGPCRGVLMPVLPVLELTPASFACCDGDGRPTEMLHAPCSTLHAPSCSRGARRENSRWTTVDSQSFFLRPYIPTYRTLVTASSLLLPAFVPFCAPCSRRLQLQPSCTVRHTCTRTVLQIDRQPSSGLVWCGFARSRGP